MNLRILLQGKATITQYEIMARADRLFRGARQGRYFGGMLTAEELATLTEGLRLE